MKIRGTYQHAESASEIQDKQKKNERTLGHFNKNFQQAELLKPHILNP